MSLVDLKPAIDVTFQVVDGVIVTVLIPWIGGVILKRLHIGAQTALGQKIIATASNAAAYGLAKAQSEADAHASSVDIKNAAVAAGVGYLNQAVKQSSFNAAKITVSAEDIVTAQLQKLALAAPPVTITKTEADGSTVALSSPLLHPQVTMAPIADPTAAPPAGAAATFMGEPV